jgi:hypothetical protein
MLAASQIAANAADSVDEIQKLVELEVATHPKRLLSIEPVRAALEKWANEAAEDSE